MSKGYVYVLSNASMPGLLKIGKTTRSPQERASELFVTGVPEPFTLEHAVLSPDCGWLEAKMHNLFRRERVDQGREFFRVAVEDARDAAETFLFEQVEALVAEFIPDQLLVEADLFIDPTAFDRSVYREIELRVLQPPDVARAFSLIKGHEMVPALDRRVSEIARRKVTPLRAVEGGGVE